ncbi:hypothetical protein [Pseudomonas lactis]|nr:hypothetical protein [Pseudomonas lactis]
MSVGNICLEVGCPTLSNSNRHFRIEMHQTPSEYRRQAALPMFHSSDPQG